MTIPLLMMLISSCLTSQWLRLYLHLSGSSLVLDDDKLLLPVKSLTLWTLIK